MGWVIGLLAAILVILVLVLFVLAEIGEKVRRG